MRLGTKSLGKVYSLGHKPTLNYSLGHKQGSIIMTNQNASKGMASTPHSVIGVGESNMIYNKSNLGNFPYYPMGRKTNQTKKSYLEKR